jgi:cytoskeletal protein CcmA (bactofilin family)
LRKDTPFFPLPGAIVPPFAPRTLKLSGKPTMATTPDLTHKAALPFYQAVTLSKPGGHRRLGRNGLPDAKGNQMSNPYSPTDSARAASGKSVLAADLRITGDIVTAGSIEVMGEVDGSLTAGALIVTHEGRVKGRVKAETVDIRGKLSGQIDGASLTLRSAAQVTADVNYRTVSIESGAQVEGKFSHKKG